MTLTIDFNWVDAGRSLDEYSSATMADLRIAIADTNLTSHVNRSTRSYNESITVPLYPIAEWLTSWWWPIFYEYGESTANKTEENTQYLERHDLAYSASGFVYPSMLCQPTGEFLEIRSRRINRRHSPIEFINFITYDQIPIQQAKAEFSKLVEAVIERLGTNGLDNSSAKLDWEAISEANRDERAFCMSAGLFGLDPYDTDEETARVIERLTAIAEPSIRNDLFSIVSPTSAEILLDVIQRTNRRIERESSCSVWTSLSQDIPSPSASSTPWEAGYQSAQWVRGQMKLNGQRVDFSNDDRHVASVDLDIDNSATRLNAVVAANSPTCAIRSCGNTAQYFAKARAVGDYLMRDTSGPSLLTTMGTDRQARTRSFAAEFLAPSAGIRSMLGDKLNQWIDEYTIEKLAHHYGVSNFVIMHQIKNHKLGKVEE